MTAHANTPPQVGAYISLMPNLSSELWKILEDTAFVSISAYWSSNLTKGNRIIFSSRFCLIKCRSTSTCFVRSCWTGLWEMSMAALLSQNKFISELGAIPISVSNLLSQRSSQRPLAIPRNSASALGKATTFCFLLLHVTRLPPTNVN